MSTDTSTSGFRLTRRTILVGLGVLAAVVVIVVLLQDAGGGDGLGLISQDPSSSYLGVTLLVFLDGVCPVFPGETTLNAASTLAAQGKFDLWLVILSGAVGAIAGDSVLYWVARLFSGRLDERVAHVKQNEKVAAALVFLGDSTPLLLTAGRFVPGLRFVVNATLGIESSPYPRFLLWSAIGGTLWSAYTCGLAYAVGTALANFPLASVIISGTITTILLGVIFWKLKRDRRSAHDA
jgi:membrane-associated protein